MFDRADYEINRPTVQVWRTIGLWLWHVVCLAAVGGLVVVVLKHLEAMQ